MPSRLPELFTRTNQTKGSANVIAAVKCIRTSARLLALQQRLCHKRGSKLLHRKFHCALQIFRGVRRLSRSNFTAS